ncbi:hypothetical protein E1B28_006942 [Marasmius oreades]|uniref:Uncharacterized protein n=1 Tax=Marasmius oreades TaxID=181124 RepID=A0A9P7UVF1_9AGAR|nr:uncharacterized protein E1B28_006942 [Marasmius oreades]KAG7093259.1 hypothetical protein E1B28_006942 [Marasmius oreades]
MPPKFDKSQLEACFQFSGDKTQIYCTVCSPKNISLTRKYFAVKSHKDHMQSKGHASALKQLESARLLEKNRRHQQEEDLQKEREMAPATLASLPNDRPIPTSSASQNLPLSSKDFWVNADYDLGPNPDVEEQERQKIFEWDMDDLENWGDERLGEAVGLDDKTTTEEGYRHAAEQEEEEMLVEMMANAGK